MSEQALDAADQSVMRLSLAAMPTEIETLDGVLLHVNHGLYALSGMPNDRGLNFLAALLLHRAFGSLWRAREDAVRGYSVSSLVLCRTALEDWATLYYVERHPETHVLWLKGVVAEASDIDREPPRVKTILNDIDGQLGARAREAYSLLSWFVHPRGGGLSWLYHYDRETTYFHVGGYFSQRDLRTCLYFTITIAQMLLERVAQLQFRVTGDVKTDWLSKGLELSDEAERFVDAVHAELATDSVVSAHTPALKELENY